MTRFCCLRERLFLLGFLGLFLLNQIKQVDSVLVLDHFLRDILRHCLVLLWVSVDHLSEGGSEFHRSVREGSGTIEPRK